MIAADTDYEVSAIKYFMSAYGVNPGRYTVVLKRKPGMKQTDGLTVPASADKFVVFISDKASGAELLRLIAHEVAHVCQIIKGDMSFKNIDGNVNVLWHGKIVDPDKIPYRVRPWEVEAFTLEKKYVHEFVKQFGNQMQESKQIKAGDIVKIKKEWQDDGDDKITWVADKDEEKGKVVISDKNSKLAIIPTQLVNRDMLEGIPMKTFEEFTEAAIHNADMAPNSWMADMEKVWPMHYKRLMDKVDNLAQAALSKGEYKDYQKAVTEFASAIDTFNYLFQIMADYNKGTK